MSNIKSMPSHESVLVAFRNGTDRKADLYWVDFSGKLVKYASAMAPGARKGMTTYVTHAWVARDTETGEQLCMSGQSVYVASAPASSATSEHPGQLEIVIHIPGNSAS